MTAPNALSVTLSHLVVTRPETQSAAWRTALQKQLGVDWQVHALPLLEIAPVAAPLQLDLQRCWSELPRHHAAMFVSPAAVQHFFATNPHGAQQWNQQRCRAWVVGQGSRQALLDKGVSADLIDCPPTDAEQFASEALWPLVEQQLAQCRTRGLSVLHVRGSDASGNGREWLAAALQKAGVTVESVTAYMRTVPVWNAAQHQLAQQLVQQPCHWLFSSRLAITHLAQLLPSQDWSIHTAIATHPRIAYAAGDFGFGRVLQCRPLVASVVQSIQSIP